VNEKATISNS